ncbi:MAG: D-glutamate deacylase, partial [Chloroflexota bacterium]
MKEGALSIGISLEYVPGISTDELNAMAEVARDFNRPMIFHLRYSDMEEPGTNFEAINEVI